MTLTPMSSGIQKEKDVIINDPVLDHKLDLIIEGAKPYLREHLLSNFSVLTHKLHQRAPKHEIIKLNTALLLTNSCYS